MLVANNDRGDFLLIGKAGGKTLVERTIGPDTVVDGRANIAVERDFGTTSIKNSDRSWSKGMTSDGNGVLNRRISKDR